MKSNEERHNSKWKSQHDGAWAWFFLQPLPWAPVTTKEAAKCEIHMLFPDPERDLSDRGTKGKKKGLDLHPGSSDPFLRTLCLSFYSPIWLREHPKEATGLPFYFLHTKQSPSVCLFSLNGLGI